MSYTALELWAAARCRSGGDPMTSYFLSKHVYFCVRGSDVVFLDLKADKYFSIAATKGRSIAPALAGNSPGQELRLGAGTLQAVSPVQSMSDTALAALLKRGLLTTDSESGKEVAATRVEAPSTDLIGIVAEIESGLNARDVLKFLRATTTGWLLLKTQRLQSVVARVHQRREARGAQHALDFDAAKRCIALFERMRPFAFSAHNACLFESLVLIEFLAHYRLYPSWVFGVQTTPFAAHCWLQYSHVAFNDSAEHTNEFTPIMVV